MQKNTDTVGKKKDIVNKEGKLGLTPGLVPSCAFLTDITAYRSQKLQNGQSFSEYLK